MYKVFALSGGAVDSILKSMLTFIDFVGGSCENLQLMSVNITKRLYRLKN